MGGKAVRASVEHKLCIQNDPGSIYASLAKRTREARARKDVSLKVKTDNTDLEDGWIRNSAERNFTSSESWLLVSSALQLVTLMGTSLVLKMEQFANDPLR